MDHNFHVFLQKQNNLKLDIFKKGELKGKIEVILNGYENNLSTPVLATITKISEQDVIRILKDNKKM